ncbi:MAG: very-long-chain (3R)-3-hydroxyacyl-CoA dehydratase 2 [Bacteroidetes bacterium]|nr:very-long-chain (3R)-3-hydroxyacyl-CoA dehydratase 2 [Bacteroidota bacterium]
MKKGIKYYLLAYNGIAFLAWAAFALAFLAKMGSISLLLLNIAQGLAVLEIIHAVLGWVRSPLGSTAAQVASRILVLILLNLFIGDEELRYAFYGLLMVSFAWTLTELIRYSFYFLGLLGRQPRWLLWMRYSFFIFLYPFGVTGEWLVILSPIIAFGFKAQVPVAFGGCHSFDLNLTYYSIFAAFLAISYIYYFPVLYGYMWKQRKAKL